MRITARQLRQIIKEELHRGMREADEVEMDAMAMPPEPKKRGFLDKVFGPSEALLAWNDEWSELSQGEKDVYVAGVKRDPNLPKIAGDAVKNKAFDMSKFRNFLETPYPGGSKELETAVGGRPSRTDSGDWVLPDGQRLETQSKNFASRFSERFLFTRVTYLKNLASRNDKGYPATAVDFILFKNADLVAVLENMFNTYIMDDEYTGRIIMPKAGSPIYEFLRAASAGGDLQAPINERRRRG
jgi:hypothetical protein